MSEASNFSQNFSVSAEGAPQSSSVSQAVSEAKEARQQYSSRTVHAPEGKVQHAHYVYAPPTPKSHTRHYGRQRGQGQRVHPAYYGLRENVDTSYAKGEERPKGKGFLAGLLKLLGLS